MRNRSGWQESNLRSPVPETGGVACSPTARRRSWSTPGGTRTRSFRDEGPASSPLRPRGPIVFVRRDVGGSGFPALAHRAPAAGLEPALSRVTAARLTDSTTPEHGGSRIRTCETGDRLRLSKALPYQLAMPPERKERESNPQGPKARPFSRRDTAPGGSPSTSDPGRRRTCNLPVKSRLLCRLSYGAMSVAGRDRTCGASRFRRALYRAELRPHDRRGWIRTSDILFVRQAL